MDLDARNNKIRVLVVDDSVLMSRTITGILSGDDTIEVVGRAQDGLEALDMVRDLKPDVVTMDVEMPRMNGITALKHIMVRHSIPTVMISALTREGARATFDALKYGAVDVIAKPSRREDENLAAQKADIIAKVRRAAAIRMGRARYIRMPTVGPAAPKSRKGRPDPWTRFIGVGTGTGGYYALLRIIPALSSRFEDVLIAMILVASRYVEPFASYLDAHSALPVRKLTGAIAPEKGTCYICSEEDEIIIENKPDGSSTLTCKAKSSDSQQTSALDRMLKSLASSVGPRAVGVVMTGPGADGAEGLAEIRKAGGIGVIQDINNCMDPSMPLAALEKGSVEKVLPDYLMADFFMKPLVSKQRQ